MTKRTSPVSAVRRGHQEAFVSALRRADLSRRELAEYAGVGASTTAKIIDQLRSHGLVTETEGRASGLGRPGKRVAFNPRAASCVGVVLEKGLVRAGGGTLAGSIESTSEETIERLESCSSVAESVVKVVREASRLLNPAPRATCIAVPGAVSGDCIRVVPSIKSIEGLQFARELRGKLDPQKIIFVNDTNAATRALAKLNDSPDLFGYLFVGKGVGAGLWIDGAPYEGHRGQAGEVGEIVVGEDGSTLETLLIAARDESTREPSPALVRYLACAVTALATAHDLPHVFLEVTPHDLGERALDLVRERVRSSELEIDVRSAPRGTNAMLNGALARAADVAVSLLLDDIA